MTERKRFVFVVLGVLAALLLVVSPVAAKATVTEFTGTQVLLSDIPAVMYFPNGNIHTREGGHVLYMIATDPRVQGVATIICQGNFDGNFVGPMSGTFTIVPDIGGGWWEGVWTGKINSDGSISSRAVGHGRGDFEGMKLKLSDYNPEWPPLVPGVSVITGRILDPHGG